MSNAFKIASRQSIQKMYELSRRTQSFGKGAFLFREGEPSEYVYLIKNGLVRVQYEDIVEGTSSNFKISMTGDLLGAMLFWDGSDPFIVAAKAFTPVEV